MCPFGDFYVPTFPIPFQFKVVKLKANSYRPSEILMDLVHERKHKHRASRQSLGIFSCEVAL